MKPGRFKRFNTITVKISIPIFLTIVVLGASLYYLVLRNVTDFANQSIKRDLENISRNIYDIVDLSYQELLNRGQINDKVSLVISQGKTIGAIEEFFRHEGIKAKIYTISPKGNQQKVLYASELVAPAATIPENLLHENRIGNLIIGGSTYYTRYFQYNAWQWHIVILKDAIEYAEFIGKVQQTYQVTGIILLLFTLLLIYYLRMAITLPITEIITPLGKGEYPTFKGTHEFEYLSDSIREMMITIKENEVLQRQKTKELEKAKKSAEIAAQAKSDFLASMSHEIRTPLNAVTGFSELLTSLVEDEKQKSYLSAIKNAGKNLLTLISDILDLSKIEANRMEIQYSPTNLVTILNEIEQIFALQISRKNLHFTIAIEDQLPDAFQLDEIRLRQVLLNVVGNAVKFTDTGSITVSVTTEMSPGKNNLCDIRISVKDTGIGISEDDIGYVFDSFRQQTGQNSLSFGGTGLGLAISKRLLEMMNGEITVNSVQNQGSTFTILIKDVETSLEPLPETEDSFNHDTVYFERGRVLVVDDVESNRKFLIECLNKVNLEVLTAVNGYEAIIISPEYQPDVILMDLKMPVLDGFLATKQLKASKRTATIPIIAVTASSPTMNPDELADNGFEGFISKPVRIDLLFKELGKHLPFHTGMAPSEHISLDPKETTFRHFELLTAEQAQQLYGALEQNCVPKFKKLQMRQPINGVLEFANLVKNLGDTSKVEPLQLYGQKLIASVERYDILLIRQMLRDFKSILDELRDASERNV